MLPIPQTASVGKLSKTLRYPMEVNLGKVATPCARNHANGPQRLAGISSGGVLWPSREAGMGC